MTPDDREELLETLAHWLTTGTLIITKQNFFPLQHAKGDFIEMDFNHEVGKIILGYLNAPTDMREEIDFIASDNVR